MKLLQLSKHQEKVIFDQCKRAVGGQPPCLTTSSGLKSSPGLPALEPRLLVIAAPVCGLPFLLNPSQPAQTNEFP